MMFLIIQITLTAFTGSCSLRQELVFELALGVEELFCCRNKILPAWTSLRYQFPSLYSPILLHEHGKSAGSMILVHHLNLFPLFHYRSITN